MTKSTYAFHLFLFVLVAVILFLGANSYLEAWTGVSMMAFGWMLRHGDNK